MQKMALVFIDREQKETRNNDAKDRWVFGARAGACPSIATGWDVEVVTEKVVGVILVLVSLHSFPILAVGKLGPAVRWGMGVVGHE